MKGFWQGFWCILNTMGKYKYFKQGGDRIRTAF